MNEKKLRELSDYFYYNEFLNSDTFYAKFKDKIIELLAVRDERNEESVCYCAEINSRNCPKHQNSEESADWKEILEEAKRFIADSFIYRPDWTVQDGDRRKPEQTWEEGKNVVISYLPVLINRTIQAERTRIIKALKGLKVENPTWDTSCDVCFGNDLQCKLRVYSEYKEGFNSALDQAIKAVGESAANSARKEKDEK